MKILKYIAALAVLTMAFSCNESEPEGAGDATIGFARTEYTYKESAGLVKIPVQFTGEPKHYPITFDVEVSVLNSDKGVDEIFHFTQSKGLKYAGIEGAPANLEFQILDDTEINEDRTFTFTITNVDGATVAGGTSTITVSDNDNNPYEKLWGNWTFNSEGAAQFSVNISGGFTEEEVASNADKRLVLWGWYGYQESSNDYDPTHQPVWYLDYDPETLSLSLVNGELLTNLFTFNGIDENVDVKMSVYDLTLGAFDHKYALKATISEDLNTITFETGYAIAAYVWGVSGTAYGYWNRYPDVTLTR